MASRTERKMDSDIVIQSHFLQYTIQIISSDYQPYLSLKWILVLLAWNSVGETEHQNTSSNESVNMGDDTSRGL